MLVSIKWGHIRTCYYTLQADTVNKIHPHHLVLIHLWLVCCLFITSLAVDGIKLLMFRWVVKRVYLNNHKAHFFKTFRKVIQILVKLLKVQFKQASRKFETVVWFICWRNLLNFKWIGFVSSIEIKFGWWLCASEWVCYQLFLLLLLYAFGVQMFDNVDFCSSYDSDAPGFACIISNPFLVNIETNTCCCCRHCENLEFISKHL